MKWSQATVAAMVVALAALIFGFHERGLHSGVNAHILTTTLQPIATLLSDNQKLLKDLKVEANSDQDASILASYLALIRRDGLPRHAQFKQRLDQIAENNTTIVALTTVYAPRAVTPAFATEADKFRTYASAWRDRWNSEMEIFMAGGNVPSADVPYPAGFASAVQAEITAAR